MLLASSSSSYPLLNLFWTMFEFFLWVIWFWVLIMVFIDIFRSHDLSGTSKALWFLFVLLIPLFGVLAYLIVRGGSMHERQARQVGLAQDAYYGSAAPAGSTGTGPTGTSGPDPSASTADQLTKLADLRDRGVISAEEFDREKGKILA